MNQQAEKNSTSLEQVSDEEFKISGNLDYQSVPLILQKSTTLFAKCSSIKVDLASVNRSDSAGLALLVQWMRYAHSTDKSISFHNLPLQMQEIAKVCGVYNKLPI